MRVFFAFLPDDKTKARLLSLSKSIRTNAIGGNFTSLDNFHVTLVFVGEVDQASLGGLISVVEQCEFSPIIIKTKHLGFFSNKGSKDILVWHIERTNDMLDLYDDVTDMLNAKGFQVDEREYRPHFTLARRVHFPQAFLARHDWMQPPQISMKCARLSLMEALRVDGRITYREIHGRSVETPYDPQR